MADEDYFFEMSREEKYSMDDAVGRWQGIYDPTSNREVGWVLYVSQYLPDLDEE